ncbi:copper chaperone PCu(A)C [Afifella pfennigii]|uniref:copper chaperone PCu(A)C n=1 Tax=Afifella pfennigii TaxID=209897 RepID=UPI00047C88EB|nr:copper chaperone PCu(A)C [Afifella pfennigii]
MRTLLAAVATAFMAVASPVFAADYTAGPIEIDTPWTRATPPSAKAGGGFLKLTNTGSEDDRLVSVASPIAGRTELHTMDMSGGVMKMRHLPDGIALPAGQSVELKPGSLHVMFMDLAGPIEEGAAVQVTLTFEKAGSVDIEMRAAGIGAPGPADMAH